VNFARFFALAFALLTTPVLAAPKPEELVAARVAEAVGLTCDQLHDAMQQPGLGERA
jgi:hypothetical protein